MSVIFSNHPYLHKDADKAFYDCTQIKKEYINILNEKTIDINNLLEYLNTTLCYYTHNNINIYPTIVSQKLVQLMRENPEKSRWDWLSLNSLPEAIQLLRENLEKIHWDMLSSNPLPEAIQLLRENPEKIDWECLSLNSSLLAIQLLRENPEKISWDNLSLNKSLWAIQLLRENPEKIDWDKLSGNSLPGSIQMLRENPDKINWKQFKLNEKAYQLLCPYDYAAITRLAAGPFRDELFVRTLKPPVLQT